VDQRVEKTYTALQLSMRELLGTMTWDQISVQALCERAAVSRSTFYAHFKDKNDLLDSLLAMFEQGMRSDNSPRSLQATGTFKFLPILLAHISSNRQLFAKNNTSAEGYPIAMRFRDLIGRLVAYELQQSAVKDDTLAQYVAGGIYWSVVQWSASTDDSTHLNFLQKIDQLNSHYLSQLPDSLAAKS